MQYIVILICLFSCAIVLNFLFNINPITLRKAKIVYNFCLSECNRVNKSDDCLFIISYLEFVTKAGQLHISAHRLRSVRLDILLELFQMLIV